MVMKYLFIRLQAGLAHGLLGYYYAITDTSNFNVSSSPIMVRVDQSINFIWFEPPSKNFNSMDFMVEWYGYLDIRKDGYYILFMECDDGCIMKLGDEVLINGWFEQPPTLYYSEPIYLSKGSYEVYIRYFNIGPFGLVKLGWVTPEGRVEDIPTEYLYTRRGDNVIVKGLPPGSVVEVWSNKMLDKAVVSDGGMAFLKVLRDRPIDGYFRILNNNEVIQSPIIRDIWGGDVFEVKEVS
jgi:hypothetical protein